MKRFLCWAYIAGAVIVIALWVRACDNMTETVNRMRGYDYNTNENQVERK